MSSFKYAAKDKDGRPVTGVAEATDQRSLVELLRKQSLIIISVKEEKKKSSKAIMARVGGKIKLSELVLFSRQLATMIDSGIPLVQSLEILTEQIESPGFRAIVGPAQRN